MVCTLVLALEMHGKRVVTRFLNYLGNSSFALQLPPSKPPLVLVVIIMVITCACAEALHCYIGGLADPKVGSVMAYQQTLCMQSTKPIMRQ